MKFKLLRKISAVAVMTMLSGSSIMAATHGSMMMKSKKKSHIVDLGLYLKGMTLSGKWKDPGTKDAINGRVSSDGTFTPIPSSDRKAGFGMDEVKTKMPFGVGFLFKRAFYLSDMMFLQPLAFGEWFFTGQKLEAVNSNPPSGTSGKEYRDTRGSITDGLENFTFNHTFNVGAGVAVGAKVNELLKVYGEACLDVLIGENKHQLDWHKDNPPISKRYYGLGGTFSLGASYMVRDRVNAFASIGLKWKGDYLSPELDGHLQNLPKADYQPMKTKLTLKGHGLENVWGGVLKVGATYSI